MPDKSIRRSILDTGPFDTLFDTDDAAAVTQAAALLVRLYRQDTNPLRLLSIREAAEAKGMPLDTMYQLVRQGTPLLAPYFPIALPSDVLDIPLIPPTWPEMALHPLRFYPDPGSDPTTEPSLAPNYDAQLAHPSLNMQLYNDAGRMLLRDGRLPDANPELTLEAMAASSRPAPADPALARSRPKKYTPSLEKRNLGADRHKLLEGSTVAKAVRGLNTSQYDFLCWCIEYGWNPAAFDTPGGLDLPHARVPRPSVQKDERERLTVYRELAERYNLRSFALTPDETQETVTLSGFYKQADGSIVAFPPVPAWQSDDACREPVDRPYSKREINSIKARSAQTNADALHIVINEKEMIDPPMAEELRCFFLHSASRGPGKSPRARHSINKDPLNDILERPASKRKRQRF